MKKLMTILAIASLAAFGLAACGDDDDDGGDTTVVETTTEAAPDGPGGTVEISAPADNSFDYDQDSVTVEPGLVTIEFDNPASLSHDVVVETQEGEELARTDLIAQDSDTVDVELAEGTYTFYCSVPGHREGGMEGTLNVK